MWDDSLWLLIAERGFDGEITAYVSEMTLKEHKRGDMIGDPSMRLNRIEAQNLMDQLWESGLRPSSGEGNAGQLGAIERHLEDMRKLVFEQHTEQTRVVLGPSHL
jgi:hypothetical protein